MYKYILPIIYCFSLILFGCGGGTQTVKVNLKCNDDCNGNNAIVVSIYQLKSADKFRNASFESLLRDPVTTLAGDLLPDSKFQITLVPGQIYQLKKYTVQKDAVYIGVVGDFHSPANDGWLKVIPVTSGINPLNIIVHKNYLTVQKNN